MNKFPILIATSVVRGSQQGESHGGIYTLDFENQVAKQHVDWNTGIYLSGLRTPAVHRHLRSAFTISMPTR